MTRTQLLANVAAVGQLLNAGSSLAQTSPQRRDAPLEAPSTKSQVASAVPSGENVGLEDIVVTAQRRSENLQRVPISVAVATSAQLQSSGVNNVQSLKLLTPGVEVLSNNGYVQPFIRGVGSKATGPGIETPIAFYVDGVYYGAPIANLMSFNNIEQVEVLKGPQGTLFGRNATGGLIQIRTRDPKSELGGEVKVEYGNYQTLRGDLYLTGAVTSGWLIDIAAQGTTMGDGYGTNLFTGKDVYRIKHDIAFRSKSLITLGDATEARVILDYSDTKNNMNATRSAPNDTIAPPFGPPFDGRPWDVDLSYEPLSKVEAGGASLRLDHDFGGVKLASITAYRASEAVIHLDLDYSRVDGRQLSVKQRDRQFSQEVQLLSDTPGPFTWVAGLYYYTARARYLLNQVDFNGVAALPTTTPGVSIVRSNTFSHQDTDSLSAFGQATLSLTDSLKATAGLRYTSEKRTLGDAQSYSTLSNGVRLTTVPLFSASERFKKLTWRAALDYQFSDAVLGYVSYNRGFKSGGFNPSGLTIPPYRPEVLDAYEAGLKTTLLDRRVRLNGAFYYYDYQDLQVQRAVPLGATGIYNSEGAKIYGADLDLQAQITTELTVGGGYQYAHGRYKDFPGSLLGVPRTQGGYLLTPTGNAKGNVTTLTPKHTVSARATYTVPLAEGDLSFTGSYYYNSGSYPDPDNVIFSKSYNLVNASVQWRSSGLSLRGFLNNITNATVENLDGLQASNFGVHRVSYAAPRTYGISVGYEF